MKTGDKFNIEYEVVKPVTTGERWVSADTKEVETLDNRRGNLWWAKPVAGVGPQIVVCSDGQDSQPG